MRELMDSMPPWLPLVLAALVVLALVIAFWAMRRQSGSAQKLAKVLTKISYSRLAGIVVPKVDEGEIQLDLILLTGKGLLIVEVKNAEGVVFGSDRMQDWTVISGDRRYTFANPQGALYDRVAAVRQIIREIPVEGRIVFNDDAKFTKGIPSHVSSSAELLEDFPKANRKQPPPTVQAFQPHWDRLRDEAVNAQMGKLVNS